MRSPADGPSLREWCERALRGAALALIAFAIWHMVRGASTAAERVDGTVLEQRLPSLIATPLARLHVQFRETPSPEQRDELAAMARAGTRVTWSGSALVPLAMTAERIREPSASVRVVAESPATIELRDALGVVDTLRAGVGTTLETGSPSGALSARAGGTSTSAAVAPAGTLRSVLVLGRASWESKFVVAALEEDGWTVGTRIVIAPSVDVTQGVTGVIDTARYAAVIVLDSALGGAGRDLGRYVRDGGGLVLLADAASAPALRGIAPARVGARHPPVSRAVSADSPLDALPLFPLESPRADAVRLAARGAETAAAARREGAGRIVQVGYDETWRWRMQGGDDGPRAHRTWWSRLVASAVASPLLSASDPASAEGAPMARLVDALGPQAAAGDASRSSRLPSWFLPVLLAVLLAEWTSRRLRGVR
jgi:hypothetical protein